MTDHAEFDDIDALKAALAAERAALETERAARQQAEARIVGAEAMIKHLKLEIAKLKRDKYGHSSERQQNLLDQLELQLEDLETAVAEEDAATESKADDTVVHSFVRRRPVRAPLPAHLPRERVVVPGPTACPCCGGKLAKLGEDITETLEVIPRQWKVIQTVREKFTCRSCETISQPPAPFHAIARGRAGPHLLAMILCAKFDQHQPLNRQSDLYAREGVELDTSTLADWVGASVAVLTPLHELIRRHVLAAERLHGDDTTVPVLAPGRTITGRLWAYVRDDRPFGGADPPAAIFHYSRDRSGEHPRRHLASYAGILQADAYGGFNDLYRADRKPGPITEAACWAHGRRKFFVLAEITKAPLALEAVQRIDAIFAVERDINGQPAAARLSRRQVDVAPRVAELAQWMRAERARVSRHAEIAKAIDYMLKRWPAFTRFLDVGHICLTNNAAERALRGVALGRKAWLFAGSDRGGERAAAMYSLIVTAKLNDVDLRAWLADVLRRINDHPASRLDELLPWNWKLRPQAAAA
ncbi:MAG: IS66 family transposase [Alphaproteobacteria bacterium]|nr:IS66 family transposase [Alphaproteobacteria bacterium]